jgi:hypothetical protein
VRDYSGLCGTSATSTAAPRWSQSPRASRRGEPVRTRSSPPLSLYSHPGSSPPPPTKRPPMLPTSSAKSAVPRTRRRQWCRETYAE